MKTTDPWYGGWKIVSGEDYYILALIEHRNVDGSLKCLTFVFRCHKNKLNSQRDINKIRRDNFLDSLSEFSNKELRQPIKHQSIALKYYDVLI